MSELLEVVAVVLNIAYVILATRENVWCWPLGIVGSGLSIWLFIDAQLYAESVLFTYYVFMGFYGWYQWIGKRTEENQLKIKDWTWKKHIRFSRCRISLYFSALSDVKNIHRRQDATPRFFYDHF